MAAYQRIEATGAKAEGARVLARLAEPFADWTIEIRTLSGVGGSGIAELRLMLDEDALPPRDADSGARPPGVSTKLLRSITLDPLEVEARRATKAAWVDMVDRFEDEHEANKQGVKKSGRPPLTREHHRRVALAYLDLQAQGHGRGIIQELARVLDVTPTKASDWVHRARKAGFLSPAIPGRPGAEPGPALIGKE